MQERLQSYRELAQEAEKQLSEKTEIPQASLFNYKTALEAAQEIIERQKKALAVKSIVDADNEKLQVDNRELQAQVKELRDKNLGIELRQAEERQKANATIGSLSNSNQNLLARLEQIETFFRWNTEAALMRNDYEREQRLEAQRRVEEQRRQAQEREQQERERKHQEQKAKSLERRPRGMGMGR